MTRLGFLAIFIAYSGCTVLPQQTVEEIVAERASAQARALIDRDYDAALKYVVPSYQNSARAEFYKPSHAGSYHWTNAEVRWVRCGDEGQNTERCEVRLWIYGQAPMMGQFMSQRGDDVPFSWDHVWLKIDGQWYQYLQ